LNDKFQSRLDYPISSFQYQYRLSELIPSNKQILHHTSIYFLDGHDIKSFFLPKGTVRTLINLKNLIMNEEIQYFEIDIRPKSLGYHQDIELLVQYKVQNTFFRYYAFIHNQRSLVANINTETGIFSDNYQEMACYKSFFLG
jgi:hypothetical protein